MPAFQNTIYSSNRSLAVNAVQASSLMARDVALNTGQDGAVVAYRVEARRSSMDYSATINSTYVREDGATVMCSLHFLDLVHRYGGSISAEHGIGRMKREENSRFKSEIELEMMRRVKQAFDPKGLMNPGKLL